MSHLRIRERSKTGPAEHHDGDDDGRAALHLRPAPGTDLVRGPGGALFQLDDATGRVGRLEPASASYPESLPLPAGSVPHGLAVTYDRLLVTAMDLDDSSTGSPQRGPVEEKARPFVHS